MYIEKGVYEHRMQITKHTEPMLGFAKDAGVGPVLPPQV